MHGAYSKSSSIVCLILLLGFSQDRLRTAQQYFDLFRVDHIVGFFRVWAIPENASSAEGFYIPEKPQQQQAQGKFLELSAVDGGVALKSSCRREAAENDT
jgi:hypothetical protein